MFILIKNAKEAFKCLKLINFPTMWDVSSFNFFSKIQLLCHGLGDRLCVNQYCCGMSISLRYWSVCLFLSLMTSLSFCFYFSLFQKYIFTMEMTCEGCSGAAKRVLAKIGGKDFNSQLIAHLSALSHSLDMPYVGVGLRDLFSGLYYIRDKD